MSYDVYVISRLRDLSDGDLALQLEIMADILEDHRAYKGQDLPPCIPGPPNFREHSVELKHASAAAQLDENAEPGRIAAVRENSIQDLTFSIQYVVMFSTHEKDPTLLDKLGLETRHRSFTKETLRVPDKPTKFSVKHNTGSSGSVNASTNSWEGKGSVELQICEGDPADEASWRTLNIFHSCRMRVDGLEPARRCYFRARLRNDAGNGPWSDVVGLIIL